MRAKFILFSKAYLPVLAWAGLIFYLSSQSVLAGLEINVLDFIFKKSAHMFVYFVLYFLTFRAELMINEQRKNRWLVPIIICLLYALSDEFHQSFTPGRHASFRDIGFDSLGVLIAFMRIYHYI